MSDPFNAHPLTDAETLALSVAMQNRRERTEAAEFAEVRAKRTGQAGAKGSE